MKGRGSSTSRGAPADLMLLLGVLSAFGPLSMDLYLPALPSMQAEFGVGQAAAQLTLSAAAIGLAAGQLLAGPLSDRLGRRGPVLVGVAAWALASLLCAVSPNVWVLSGIRLAQGIAGAAGIVLARAIVRDRFDGTAAGQAYALLASITGAAPVLAPVVGGQLLRITGWRGIFVVLAGIGLLLLLASIWRLPETLPPEGRVAGGLSTTLTNCRTLLTRRTFVAAVVAQGLGFGVLFAYISGSSFVLQSAYGLSAQQFSLVFAANGVGIVLAGQVSRLLVHRAGPRRLMLAGLALQIAGSAVLVAAGPAGWGLPVVLPALFVVATATGLMLPNATTLAMADAARMAGTASALVGVGQFLLAGIGAPLAGLGPAGQLLPMAVVMVCFAVLGSLAAAFVSRHPEKAPASTELAADRAG